MHRFYINVSDVQDEVAVMTGQDAKHLINVLRLGLKDCVELTDGCGTNYLAEIKEIAYPKVVFKIIDRAFTQCESPAHIAVAQAMLKDKKMDVILRHLTELGIKEWIPFYSLRSVPTPSHGQSKSQSKSIDVRVERWIRIAKESIKQCGRSVVPIIHEPISFEELFLKAALYDEKIAFWEKESTPFNEIKKRQIMKKQNNVIVMIGPEGGFSQIEIDIARLKGFQSFSLGSRILRAETAAIVACALIQNVFGDLGK